VFVVSSFDTDHVLVPTEHLETALTALRVAGHRVEAGPADAVGAVGAPGGSQEWRRVVDERCVECGLEAARIPVDGLALEIGRAAGGWGDLLARTDESALRLRPADDVWSPLEYACHVRDVLSLFAQRVVTTLREDEPELGWWDHEAAVTADGYNEQDARAVADDITRNAAVLAEVLAGAAGGWDRTATRAGRERFTVAGLVRFALHEAVHHLADARGTSP
jgi:hypothetical protein